MALSLVFKAESSDFEIPVRYLDWIDRLPDELSRDRDILFDVEDTPEWDTDEPHAVAKRVEMLASLERILHAVVADDNLIPRRFTFDFEIFPGVPVRDDEVHSIVLPNRDGLYVLSGGHDYCILEEISVLNNERFFRSNPVDVRHRDSIETESHGLIKIARRSERETIINYLNMFNKFLISNLSETINKTIT